MIKVIPSKNRHLSDFGWLKTYWLFSFADYYDPENIRFGALRVFNDDVVQPGTGFPTHPHREMEIITIVLEGEIIHRDSMGNKAVIRAGDVQRMSAGKGLTHSEFNLSDRPVHFYQIWIYPDKRDLQPSYDQKSFDPGSFKNNLVPVASGQGFKNSVTFHTDATIYRAELDMDRSIVFKSGDSRRIYLYLTHGRLDVNGIELNPGDQARVDLEKEINIKAVESCHLILVDVPSCRGWGYSPEVLRGSRSGQ